MSHEEKFYSTAENKSKENHISFPSIPNDAEGEEPIHTNIQEVNVDPDLLADLEELINGQQRGCKIHIEKLIPVGGEDVGKGKAPAKGKTADVAADKSKPI
jgi:hypothetical protein